MKNENFLLNFEADLGSYEYYTDYFMRLEKEDFKFLCGMNFRQIVDSVAEVKRTEVNYVVSS